MLYLYFGDIDRESVLGEWYTNVPQYYFDDSFKTEWMEDAMVKEMVLDIDKSIIKAPYLIESPVLGAIPPRMLSTGVKTLILLKCDNNLIPSGERLGDNCWKWVFRIGKIKDIVIPLNHSIIHDEFDYDCECTVVNMKNYHFKGDAWGFFKLWNAWVGFQGHKVWCREEGVEYKPLNVGDEYVPYLE